MLIEIIADFICPWCYVGKRRLDRALAQRPALRPEVRWLPFQLDPDLPAEGVDHLKNLLGKFGSLDRVRQVHALLEQTAAAEDLPLRLDRIQRSPNTRDAHRLVRFAEAHGLAPALAAALHTAHFCEGRDIGDRAELGRIAGEAGLDAGAALAHLNGDGDHDALRQALASVRQLGVQAVPCFIFNRRYCLSGAQEPLAFLPLLDLVGAETPVATPAG